MNKNINRIGIIVLIIFFLIFYLVTTFLLDKRNISKDKIENNDVTIDDTKKYSDEKAIISDLYKDVRILYDVVNNKFTVDSEDVINTGNIIYKKITNFDEIMKPLFTENGIKNYITDMGSYFAYNEEGYYLAGNLVTYQTYYFRGDNTNIYVLNSTEDEINAIIYEKWTSNYKNTLATVKVVRENNNWLIDKIEILSSD